MPLDNELIAFLETAEKAPGKSKLDGTPRKMRVTPPAVMHRNVELILSFFGLGPEPDDCPTLAQLARRFDGLTRERVRQIIEENYTNRLPRRPLPIAAQAARIIEDRELWLEQELLQELQRAGVAGSLGHALGLLAYLHSQGAATGYDIFLATLHRATRTAYDANAARLVVSVTTIEQLRVDLSAAQRLPGQSGLARLSAVSRWGIPVDYDALRKIIPRIPGAWSTEADGELWFMFGDRGNILVNLAAKLFAIVDRCAPATLAELLANALHRRRRDEYPAAALIRTWIEQSRHFSVADGLASFTGEPALLEDLDAALVEAASGKPAMLATTLVQNLEKRGFDLADAFQTVFATPLLYMDRSSGEGGEKVTLASDLPAAHPRPTGTRGKPRARPADPGGTDATRRD